MTPMKKCFEKVLLRISGLSTTTEAMERLPMFFGTRAGFGSKQQLPELPISD